METHNNPNMPSMQTAPHILVVDDDRRIRDLIRRFLTQHDMVVNTAADAAQARDHLAIFDYDAVVLDVMMPGENGLDLTRSLTDTGLNTPILLLTARGEAVDRINGLEAGADDYLPKPFEPRELLLRLKALIRRTTKAEPVTQFHFGDLVFNQTTNTLTHRDKQDIIPLTSVESQLLQSFCHNIGHTISREKLLNSSGINGNERTIDVQVTRLRRKIEPDAKRPRFLQTVRGEGYVLHADKG